MIDEELDGDDLVRVVDVYHLFYKDEKLKQGADTVNFTMVVAHLKAGNTTPDALERHEAAKSIMDYLDKNVVNENVIFCGDLNVYSNGEPAYQTFVNYSVAKERLNDPVNQNGNWNNNSSFAPWHTQSTTNSNSGCHAGGGMDDRFDFFLVSDSMESQNNEVHYRLNSYATIGNDGNHFNQTIDNNGNSSAPSNVIQALKEFSDHLPVVMEIEVKKSTSVWMKFRYCKMYFLKILLGTILGFKKIRILEI